MSSVQALKLEDAEGSVLLVTRIDDLAYTLAIQYAGDAPFRMFEDDRAKLRDFLRALES